jgi:hypothetical protein
VRDDDSWGRGRGLRSEYRYRRSADGAPCNAKAMRTTLQLKQPDRYCHCRDKSDEQFHQVLPGMFFSRRWRWQDRLTIACQGIRAHLDPDLCKRIAPDAAPLRVSFHQALQKSKGARRAPTKVRQVVKHSELRAYLDCRGLSYRWRCTARVTSFAFRRWLVLISACLDRGAAAERSLGGGSPNADRYAQEHHGAGANRELPRIPGPSHEGIAWQQPSHFQPSSGRTR